MRARPTSSLPRGYTIRELLITIGIIGVLLGITLPAIRATREARRRNGCMSNIRQIGLAEASVESTTKRFSLVSDAAGPLNVIPPGTYDEDQNRSSGYGWLTVILTYIEEHILFGELRRASNGLRTDPFDPELTNVDGQHFASVRVPAFVCPSYRGGHFVELGAGSEYDTLTFTNNSSPPALTSYVALVGTHANADGTINENGVIVSRCALNKYICAGQGLKLEDVGDGLSKTVIACETIEPVYAAWIDGQASWVVGIDPVGAGVPDAGGGPTAQAVLMRRTANSYSDTGLYGSAGWPGAIARQRGPSSEHSGGVVLHVFADCHAQAISTDVDPTVYYGLITRNGGEEIDPEKLD